MLSCKEETSKATTDVSARSCAVPVLHRSRDVEPDPQRAEVTNQQASPASIECPALSITHDGRQTVNEVATSAGLDAGLTCNQQLSIGSATPESVVCQHEALGQTYIVQNETVSEQTEGPVAGDMLRTLLSKRPGPEGTMKVAQYESCEQQGGEANIGNNRVRGSNNTHPMITRRKMDAD
ncbi:hypothetical protein V6N12_046457 [Hibiscus sabdariffa]|uniref:Uncharacterized protein n=1 Tax=Hibiscus sabdariffa TaxID=183260 RepID=A0ABR2DIQ7_9ROSI